MHSQLLKKVFVESLDQVIGSRPFLTGHTSSIRQVCEKRVLNGPIGRQRYLKLAKFLRIYIRHSRNWSADSINLNTPSGCIQERGDEIRRCDLIVNDNPNKVRRE